MFFRLFFATAVLLTSFAGLLSAEVKTPSVFGNGMVLQRGIDVPVWGWAEPGEKVTVKFRDQSVTTTADAAGKWEVSLAPLKVGEATVLTVKGTNTLTFEDVLVGEVWICSGQSNMAWTVSRAIDADLEALGATDDDIRFFKVPPVTAAEPQDDVDASWSVVTPETVPNFSAVGYFFARQLNHVLEVPVGMLMTSWGGTRAEAWTSPEAVAKTPEFKPIVDTWDQRAAAYVVDEAKARYDAALEKWEQQVAQARKAGRPIPRRPQFQGPPRLDRHHYSTLYNAMVAPLSPYAIKGAIWYQGESNAGRAYQYRTVMPTMIQSWRDDWGQGDFPFYQVQLANFMEKTGEPGESGWAELREAQMMTVDAIPNVGVACIIDLGAAKDIHPKDKQNVGKRLARLALVNEYGFENLVRQGPTFESLEVKDGKAIIKFETFGSPLTTYYREPLEGFAIAGADKQWKWGNAKITGKDTVEVSHPEISEPVAVRYNWANNPDGNLYSEAYLPAYPFRTDDWAGVTKGSVTP